MPVISQKELNRLKRGEGVYSNIRKTQPLKILVINTVEVAFREYAQGHKGITKELEDKYWNQFKPILEKYL